MKFSDLPKIGTALHGGIFAGKEPGRYDPYTEGASDAADLLADKIRSGL